jgi:cob(I)alamin adenosyltransferase
MSLRITRVYTRTGDGGETGLVGGQRVSKADPRIEAYGTVDELAALIGVARLELVADRTRLSPEDGDRVDAMLEFCGNKLFTLGGDLATRIPDRHPMMPVIVDDDVAFLERACDAYNGALPPLKDFVLPGGTRLSAALHVCRTVARRTEREVIRLSSLEETGELPVRYLNRLSDFLFVLSRWVNLRMGAQEVIWRRTLPEPTLPALPH